MGTVRMVKSDKTAVEQALLEAAREDPWAAEKALAEQHARDLAIERERTKQIEIQDRKDRRESRWEALGVFAIVVVALFVIGGVGLLIWDTQKGNREKEVLKEREQTEQVRLTTESADTRLAQVEACIDLPEIAERQLCIVNLGLEGPEGE
jgi:cytoskeletal protein RodZ